MEISTVIEITVKPEPEEIEQEEKPAVIHHYNDLLGNFKLTEEEVWIKPEVKEINVEIKEENVEIKEELTNVEIEFIQEMDSPDDNDVKPQDLKGSIKKRKQSLDQMRPDISDEELKEEKPEIEQSEKTEDEKPKEKYIMYSYEITKNIQIVTITEEERQIEHKENLRARQHMKHVCEDCPLGFVLHQAYLVHMKVHSKESGEFECDICHSYLKTADMLYRHKLRHYRRYRCLLCWTRFKDKDTAACHVMNEHVGTTFDCDHCGRGFKRPQYLKRHIEQYHTKPHRLECAICFRVFHERGWYRSHIRSHNEEIRNNTNINPVSCDTCSRQFKNKSSLKRHLRTHITENIPCDMCNKICKNRQTLGQHYLTVHQAKYDGAPAETCAVCLRVCATRAMLKRHMRRMHSDRTKKYQCDHCQRFYLTKGEVRSHIAWSHLAAGGHACACGKVFRTPALRREHALRVHAGLPPPRVHACDLCGKAFSNKQVLTRHKKSHSDEMYPCNECGLLFKTQPYVKIHYQIKHLNMTRAQINAQRKLNKMNRIPQNNMHARPNWEPTIKSKKNKMFENDPLSVQESGAITPSIKKEREDEEHESLYQTFDVDENE